MCSLVYIDHLIVLSVPIAEKLSTVKNLFKKDRLPKIILAVLTIALLTLPGVLSQSVVRGDTNTSTEQLTPDYTAVYIGTVNVATLPIPTEGTAPPLSLPDFSLAEQVQSGTTDPLFAI